MATKTAKRTKSTTKHAIKNKEQHPCGCGCGKTTARTFAQGHDSKAHSLLLKVDRGELKATGIPHTLRTAELAKDSAIAKLLRKLSA